MHSHGLWDPALRYVTRIGQAGAGEANEQACQKYVEGDCLVFLQRVRFQMLVEILRRVAQQGNEDDYGWNSQR